MILVQHVRRAGLHLRLQDTEPKLLCFHGPLPFAFRLETGVHGFELVTPEIHETLPRVNLHGLVGAKEGPLLVSFHASHEEVRDPKCVKKISSSLLLLSMVLLQLEKIHHVSVPWLNVHRKRTFPFASALIDVSGGLIEIAQHGHQTIAASIGATNVGTFCTNIGQSHTNTASTLGDHCTLFQSVVDAVDTVILHRQKKTRRHLGARSPRIE
mmetsp:Transcript_18776/g.50392  ORF Transcript_18776/g.50392 Transcript_18776/m.50392 type:complete len:212 (-) Transcript_18776:679-1314(-)